MSNLVDTVALSKHCCEFPIQAELAYATANNFLGRIVDGYHPEAQDLCLLTPKAANALCHVQNELIEKYQYGLMVYDAYRPKRAVMDFVKWSNLDPANDFELQRKNLHYPHITKKELFALGYVAEDSNHCYGNTVDLVLMELGSRKMLNMGAIFDYMDEKSHLVTPPEIIGQDAYRHRQILIDAMVKFGFETYEKEFWHYCHGGKSGREVSTPLDVEITPDLRGKI